MDIGYQTIPTGYYIKWSKLKATEVKSIVEDGLNFLEVYAEYTANSRMLHVQVLIDGGAYTNTCFNNKFTSEFLYELGIDCGSKITNAEKFIESLIKATSFMKYWSKPVKNMIKKKKYNGNNLVLDDKDIKWLHKFNSREKTMREIEQEKEIAALKTIIEELKNEMKDLKEEIQMLSAVNEEC